MTPLEKALQRIISHIIIVADPKMQKEISKQLDVEIRKYGVEPWVKQK